MGCEYQYQLTERALQDIRETVGYLRNDLQNEKAAGKEHCTAVRFPGKRKRCV